MTPCVHSLVKASAVQALDALHAQHMSCYKRWWARGVAESICTATATLAAHSVKPSTSHKHFHIVHKQVLPG